MRGFPKHLNTREDYDLVHAAVLAGELPADKLLAAYDALLNTRQHYVFDRTLAADEPADGEEPEYRVMVEEQEGGTMQRTQYKLVDNPDARLCQLGFTVTEIEAFKGEIINAEI